MLYPRRIRVKIMATEYQSFRLLVGDQYGSLLDSSLLLQLVNIIDNKAVSQASSPSLSTSGIHKIANVPESQSKRFWNYL